MILTSGVGVCDGVGSGVLDGGIGVKVEVLLGIGEKVTLGSTVSA
jgi:hypothetical protein